MQELRKRLEPQNKLNFSFVYRDLSSNGIKQLSAEIFSHLSNLELLYVSYVTM